MGGRGRSEDANHGNLFVFLTFWWSFFGDADDATCTWWDVTLAYKNQFRGYHSTGKAETNHGSQASASKYP